MIEASGNIIHAGAPFSGQGFAIYGALESTGLRYRKLRMVGDGVSWNSLDSDFPGSGSVPKTAALATVSHPTTSGTPTLPAAWNGSNVVLDARHFKDHIENESDAPQVVSLDVGGDGTNTIQGAASFVGVDVFAAGKVQIKFKWTPSTQGIQPSSFVAAATAGPDSPGDVTVTFAGALVVKLVTITISGLSDASSYTYKITAKNGAVESDVLTGLTVDADATGPPVPTAGSVSTV